MTQDTTGKSNILLICVCLAYLWGSLIEGEPTNVNINEHLEERIGIVKVLENYCK